VMLATSHPAVASDAHDVSAAHATVTLAQAKPRVTAWLPTGAPPRR